MNIIKLVFKDHDLKGAIKATFHLVLRVFNVPPDLLTTICAQGAGGLGHRHQEADRVHQEHACARSATAFKLLWDNIWEHLKFGLQGWLFGELADKKITSADELDRPEGACSTSCSTCWASSVDHIFELLEKKFDPTKVDKLRMWFGPRRRARSTGSTRRSTHRRRPPENAARPGRPGQGLRHDRSSTGIAEWVGRRRSPRSWRSWRPRPRRRAAYRRCSTSSAASTRRC